MDAPDPRIAFVPPGWVWPAASKKRLALLPAEMFNRTFERAPDDWLHVAPLKKPPLFLTIASGVITLFLGSRGSMASRKWKNCEPTASCLYG